MAELVVVEYCIISHSEAGQRCCGTLPVNVERRCNILTQDRANQRGTKHPTLRQNQEAADVPLTLPQSRCAGGTSDFFTKNSEVKVP